MEEEEKKKVSFLLFYDWEPLFEMLSREDRGDLISALFAYEKREELPEPSELSPQVLGLFDYLSKILDENKRQWQIRSLRGTKGGKASGEARRNKNEQSANLNEQDGTNANLNEPKDKVKDKDKDKVSPKGDIEREYKRDSDKPNPSTPKPKPEKNQIPPKIEMVRAYFVSIGSTENEADKFFDYWEARGWRNKSGLMRDWQASARTWNRNKDKFESTSLLPTPTPTAPQTQNNVTDWDKIAKEVEQLGYFDNVNNHADVFAGIPATVREDVGG